MILDKTGALQAITELSDTVFDLQVFSGDNDNIWNNEIERLKFIIIEMQKELMDRG